MKDKNIDEVIRLAAEKGFTLTTEDFAFHLDCELDPEELEQVAGGESTFGKECGDFMEFMCGIGICRRRMVNSRKASILLRNKTTALRFGGELLFISKKIISFTHMLN